MNTQIYELDDNTAITIFNVNAKKPIAQFTSKNRASTMLSCDSKKLRKALGRNGKMDTREQFGVWIAVRVRPLNNQLDLDPCIARIKEIIASQALTYTLT
jgi:hypothetical protein